MKRIICAILLLVFTLCMVGCNDKNNQDKALNKTHFETFEYNGSTYREASTELTNRRLSFVGSKHMIGYTIGVNGKAFETYVLDCDLEENILFQNYYYCWIKEGYEWFDIYNTQINKLSYCRTNTGLATSIREFNLTNVLFSDLFYQIDVDFLGQPKPLNIGLDIIYINDMAYSLGQFVKVGDEVYLCYDHYDYYKINKEYYDLIVDELNSIELLNNDNKLPEEMPDDFNFSIEYGFVGYYNSETHELKNGYNFDLDCECKTELIFSNEEMKEIYSILKDSNIDKLPEMVYVLEGGVVPSSNLVITYQIDGKTKSVHFIDGGSFSARNWDYYKEEGSVLYRIIDEYIKSSEEYKALPPNQQLYD